ncbi:MAG: hypothetical protein RIC06_05145 [Cyclobacteriaceae bacterium]
MTYIRTFQILLLTFILIGCSNNKTAPSDKINEGVNLKFEIDGNELQNQDITISYTLNGSTKSISSNNDKLILPEFDSLMSTFEVTWNNYSLGLSGDFLQYELPNILTKDVKNWYLKVDNPPFENPNIPETSDIKYIFMIHVDSARLTGLWVNKR